MSSGGNWLCLIFISWYKWMTVMEIVNGIQLATKIIHKGVVVIYGFGEMQIHGHKFQCTQMGGGKVSAMHHKWHFRTHKFIHENHQNRDVFLYTILVWYNVPMVPDLLRSYLYVRKCHVWSIAVSVHSSQGCVQQYTCSVWLSRGQFLSGYYFHICIVPPPP